MHFKKLNIISIFFTSLLLIILLACTDSNTKTETHSINLNIKNGTLVEEITIKANQKDTIIFNIRSDQRGIVHLHGYNIEMPAEKNILNTSTIEATTTGKFAIAFHFSNHHDDHKESDHHDDHKESDHDDDHKDAEHKDDDHHDDDHEKTTETHLGYLEIWPN